MAVERPPEVHRKSTRGASKSGTKYLVPVVQSTFRILGELSAAGNLNLNEITLRTGVPKSTVFRILSTLNHLGYVLRDSQERTYSLSSSLSDLANEVAGVEALRRTALPYMLRLRDEFGETVNLGTLNLDKVVYVEVVPSEYALRLSERPGVSVWPHASALGKAILAYSPSEVADSVVGYRAMPVLTPNTITDPEQFRRELQRVRERGYAFDREETTLLATCVAAPIRNGHGAAIGAMSISGPTSRFNPRRNKRVIEGLLQAVEAIGAHYHRIPEPRPARAVGNHSNSRR